jgi:hypothetical protein
LRAHLDQADFRALHFALEPIPIFGSGNKLFAKCFSVTRNTIGIINKRANALLASLAFGFKALDFLFSRALAVDRHGCAQRHTQQKDRSKSAHGPRDNQIWRCGHLAVTDRASPL